MGRNLLHRLNVIICKIYLIIRKEIYKLSIPKSNEPERIIVSMTSWAKRINNVPAVVDSILKNTVKPDKIVLNLSIDEFPNRENDLPIDVVKLQNNGFLEIGWQEGNTKAFKKIIPTMKKYPNDAIISIDDDFIYPVDFVETFKNVHKRKPDVPLSGNMVYIYGAKAHCGCASLVKADFFGVLMDSILNEKIIEIGIDDVFYTICAALNGYYYEYVGKEFFLNMKSINPIKGISDEKVEHNQNVMLREVTKIIKEKYHIMIDEVNRPRFKF